MSQNFKSIFVDEGMANELSALALKMACSKISKLVYSRQELIDISEQPWFEDYRTQYVAELKKQSHKYPWIEEIERGRENRVMDLYNGSFRRATQTNGKKDPPRPRGEDRYRNATQKNSPLNWRSGGTNNNVNNNNNHTGYERSRNAHNQNGNSNHRHNNRNNGRASDNRYGMKQNYYEDEEEEEEEEPEWMTGGPESMMDFIELKGFDDDPYNEEMNRLSSNENLSIDASSNSDRRDSRSLHDFSDFGLLDSSKSSLNPSGEPDIFAPVGPSFFNDSGNIIGSSRANKWFKKSVDSSTTSSTGTTATPAVVTTNPASSDSSNTSSSGLQFLMDKMKANLGSNFTNLQKSHSPIDIDFTKATSVDVIEGRCAPESKQTFSATKPVIVSQNNLPKSSAPSPQLPQQLPQQIPQIPQQLPPQQPASRFPMQPQIPAALMMQQLLAGQQSIFRPLTPVHQAMLQKQFLDSLASTNMVGPNMNPMVLQQIYFNTMAQNKMEALQRQQYQLQQQQLQSQHPNMNSINNSSLPTILPPQPVEVTPKINEIKHAEKLLKNLTLTPTSVFRKTRKAADQPKHVNVEKTDSVNAMFQHLKNNSNNNNNNAVSPSTLNIEHAQNIATKPNPLSLLSSLNGAGGQKLPMPMPAQAFTLDDIEKM